jgi:hypothetical protein
MVVLLIPPKGISLAGLFCREFHGGLDGGWEHFVDCPFIEFRLHHPLI